MAMWSMGDPDAPRAEKEKIEIYVQRGAMTPVGFTTDVPKGFDRDLTVGALTVKNLCRDHNSALSPTDLASKELTRALVDFVETSHARKKSGIVHPPKVLTVDGALLERWFLKTVLTHLAGAEGLPIGSPEPAPDTPTGALVEMAFGRRPIVPPIGLWLASYVDEQVSTRQDFSMLPIIKDGIYVTALLFIFRGIRFVVGLDADLPPPIEAVRAQPGWRRAVLHQPCRIIEADGLNVSIRFEWTNHWAAGDTSSLGHLRMTLA
ncbi:MAG: hypothetical protein ABL886_00965 [Rhodoglobus sp.]